MIKIKPAEIAIDVYLDANRTKPLLKKELVELEGRITGAIKEIIDDLEIPIGVKIKVTRKRGQNQPLLLLVNGIQCRLPYDYHFLSELTLSWLRTKIIKDIHCNRVLLLTPDMAQKIRESWSPTENQRYLPGLSRIGFFTYLQLLVQHGFKINRGDHINQSEITFNYYHTFEKAISKVRSIQLVLYVPQEKRTSIQKSVLQRLQEACAFMQGSLFYELGIKIPKVRIKEDALLEKKEYRIQINDLRFPAFEGLEKEEFLVNARVEELAILQINGKHTTHPSDNSNSTIVKETGGIQKACEAAGHTTWDPIAYVVLSIRGSIRKHVGYFLTLESLEFELTSMNSISPVLLQGIQQKFQTYFLIWILRELASEDFSIRDLKKILEILLTVKTHIKADFQNKIVLVPYQFNPIYSIEDLSMTEAEPAQYADTVRVRHNRYISHKFAKGQGSLMVFLLDSAIQETLVAAITASLPEQWKLDLYHAIAEKVREFQNQNAYPVILTTIDIRRKLQELIRFEFPNLVVLSFMEISPETKITPLAKISLEN